MRGETDFKNIQLQQVESTHGLQLTTKQRPLSRAGTASTKNSNNGSTLGSAGVTQTGLGSGAMAGSVHGHRKAPSSS